MTIKADSVTIKCKLSFMHLLKADDFNGKAEPKYKFRATNLSEAAVEALTQAFGEDAGMGHKRVKFDEKYPEAGQYTNFSSRFPIKVKLDGRDIVIGGKDSNGNDVARTLDPVAETIGYGSEAVVKVFADKNGNPRVQFVDIRDLVTFDADESAEEYDDSEVL